jgi:hypothetical protein
MYFPSNEVISKTFPLWNLWFINAFLEETFFYDGSIPSNQGHQLFNKENFLKK